MAEAKEEVKSSFAANFEMSSIQKKNEAVDNFAFADIQSESNRKPSELGLNPQDDLPEMYPPNVNSDQNFPSDKKWSHCSRCFWVVFFTFLALIVILTTLYVVLVKNEGDVILHVDQIDSTLALQNPTSLEHQVFRNISTKTPI